MKKLVIFGVGLIGGSLALAFKAYANKPYIVGVGRNAANLQQALTLGAIDAAETDIKKAITGADMIVLAVPVAQTLATLQHIAPHLEPTTTITDAGSTKGDVIAAARLALGDKIGQFVPAHPIAGAEKSGVGAAKADLFQDKNVILTPLPENYPACVDAAEALWRATHAHTHRMEAATHDQVFAAVSHLPHLLAFSLVNEIASRPNAAQLFGFAASGFRDFTRIAGSSPEMWRDIALANKPALLQEISAFEAKIAHLKQLLSNDDSAALEAFFNTASTARNQWKQS